MFAASFPAVSDVSPRWRTSCDAIAATRETRSLDAVRTASKRDAARGPGLIIFSHVVRLDVVVMCPGKGVAPCAPQLLRSSSFALLLALPRFPSVDLEAFPPYPLLLPIFRLLPPSTNFFFPFSLNPSFISQFLLLAVALGLARLRGVYAILALAVVLALLVGGHLGR